MPKLLPKSRIYNTQKCALKIQKSCNLGRQYEKIGITGVSNVEKGS